MRSVVVVLPASMWAMIPMFRVFSSVNLRGMGSLSGRWQKKRAPRARTNFLRGLCPNAGLCLECLHRKKAHAWAAAPAATPDYSISPVAASAPETTVPRRLTSLLLVPLVLGAVALIVAEFLPLYEIRVITAVPNGGEHSTGAHH